MEKAAAPVAPEAHMPDADAIDSDSDQWSEDEKAGKHEEDPLFDPAADDADLIWAHKKRQGRVSDAILSCPACFTTLCIDCQRHDTKVDQYRAMFATNCRVRTDTPKSLGGNAKRRGNKRVAVGPAAGEVVYPVTCEVCDTEVGVQDADEIFHFFNIVPSNA